MKYFILVICLVFSVSGAIAQESDREECSMEVLQAWQDMTFSILLRYDEAIANPQGLETVLKIQELRREFEAQEVPDCNVQPDAKLFVSLLNLTSDSLVATEAGKAELANSLSSVATTLRSTIGNIFVGFTPSPTAMPSATPGGEPATITSPVNGEKVPTQIQVRGTYNADMLDEEHHLWLFVIAPSGLVFPQANNSCTGDQREPIPFSRFNDTWSMEIGVGGPGDSGKTFTLILGLADAEASDTLHQYFDSSCPDNFPGLTQTEIFDELGVTPILPPVEVIRE